MAWARRLEPPSEWAGRVVPVVLAATIFAFAMGSSSVTWAVRVGGPLRWLMLFVLVGLATAYGLWNWQALPRRFLLPLAALVGLALLSPLWSVTPKITAEKAISFFVLVVAVLMLGAGAARSRADTERLLIGLLAAAVAVAAAGVFVLVTNHDLAVQPQAVGMPARLLGFGQNPNTAAMLFALALPIGGWLTVSARTTWLRSAAAAACVLLYGSIMASGSRGAMIAAAAGSIVFIALIVRGVRRLVPIEAIAIALFFGTFSFVGDRPSVVPVPLVIAAPPALNSPTVTTPATPSPPLSRPTSESGGNGGPPPHSRPTSESGGNGGPPPFAKPAWDEVGIDPRVTSANVGTPFPPRQDEIGYPSMYDYDPILFYGSGRVFAWLSALDTGARRPLLGYGFGTEATTFVDRSYVFKGGYTENSFVGIFLQLGLIGVLLLLAPFVMVGVAAWSAVRHAAGLDRAVVAATSGVAAAGFTVAFFQSYLYSVGNIATLTFWTAAAVAVARGSVARETQ